MGSVEEAKEAIRMFDGSVSGVSPTTVPKVAKLILFSRLFCAFVFP